MKNSILIISLFFSCGCAQMFPPRGGEKDTTPPNPVEEKVVPANKSILFNSKSILITFDEYIKLNSPNDNIIISPAMEERPEFLLKGKKLFIHLKSELKPNTTYTINFGNAVTDITENNPAAGLTYVFSTGSFIDSLQLSGNVTNAFTNVPEKNVWVLLHKNLSDTAFQKCFPDYLTKTDNSGNYSLQNLASGEYKIFALKDGNSDYKYSQSSEEIGFTDEVVSVNEKNNPVSLKLFKEDQEKQYVKSSKFTWPGKLQMVMNKFFEPWMVTILPYDTLTKGRVTSVYKNPKADTIAVWFPRILTEKDEEIKVSVRFNRDSVNKEYDTVTFLVRDQKKPIPPLKLKTNASDKFSLYDELKIKFDRPAGLKNKESLLLFKNDSVPVAFDTKTLGYGSSIIAKWEEKTNYSLIINDSAFQELYYGHYSKQDTVRFTTVKKEYYGNIIGSVIVPGKNYLLQFISARGNIINQFQVSDTSKINIENVLPGKYTLQVIEDSNENWKWDTGNLSDKKQPERVWNYKEPVVIRSNWDFELIWKIEN